MIRLIAALDYKQGIANDSGIPWQGKVPGDLKYFREMTSGSIVLMGYATYTEFEQPLPGRRNLVVTRLEVSPIKLRQGFEAVENPESFLNSCHDDIWVVGGAKLFGRLISYANELYITQLQADFNCTKFFPEFRHDFVMKSESKPITENSVTYTFQVWTRNH